VKNVVVLGGGIAGIETSSMLSGLGYNVTLVEKTDSLGGKARKWDHLFPDLKPASEILNYLDDKCRKGNFAIQKNTNIEKVFPLNGKWHIKTDNNQVLESDAVVVATGFEVFDARRKEEYGYNIYDNVITSADLEEKFKTGKLVTTRNGDIPKRIGIIHCVGSRDEKSGNQYCSKVCCITGVKQAIELHKMYPDTEIYCFYMDLRMYGQSYEELYREAQEQHTIQFIRGRLSEVSEKIDKSLLLKAEDTLSGRPLKMTVDLLVLLVGMEPGKGTKTIGNICNLEFGSDGFLKTMDPHTGNNRSVQKGIFLAGTCICPMSINDTLANARSAALEVHQYLEAK
jgi:heterodisulfide reductase subunit A2